MPAPERSAMPELFPDYAGGGGNYLFSLDLFVIFAFCRFSFAGFDLMPARCCFVTESTVNYFCMSSKASKDNID